MGTRAAFWVGNPTNLEQREWLGCVAWDGYPSGLPELQNITDEAAFRAAVQTLSARGDFAHPRLGWPYPWADDVFLTDYTYAFFDGQLQVTYFHYPFRPLATYDATEAMSEDPRHQKVPAPEAYNPSQPDSIMYLTVKAHL